MTKQMQSVFAMGMAAVMGIVLTVIPAFARPTQLIKFNLAQQTMVKGVMMPAGGYSVRDLRLGSGVPLLQIQSDSTGVQVTTFADVTIAEDGSRNAASSATVRYDGSVYRLESIRVAGTNMSYRIPHDPERN